MPSVLAEHLRDGVVYNDLEFFRWPFLESIANTFTALVVKELV